MTEHVQIKELDVVLFSATVLSVHRDVAILEVGAEGHTVDVPVKYLTLRHQSVLPHMEQSAEPPEAWADDPDSPLGF